MSERSAAGDFSSADEHRASVIERVLQTHIQRRFEGEDVNDDELIAEHQELMPELADELRLIREISDQRDANAARESADSDTAPRDLIVRCPNCRESVRLSADALISDIVCDNCGSRFSLADDPQKTQTRAASLTKRLGHFELIEQIGLGSFGCVWKARDTELDRFVAIKIPRQGKLDSTEVEHFLREARAAAQLSHPNIVSVYEVGRDGETVFIVSDLVQGVSLSDWLTGRQPSVREACKMCVTIADALHHAHEAGVIHRDLKPQNIMLVADSEPHLLDFGLARRNTGEITMTIDGNVLGTPAYMPPEQARGEAHQVSREADIYSLGVILFELVTGELPFRGNARMLIHQVLHEEAPSPRKLNNNIPKDLETICLKCLEKAPHRRFESAKLLADELRRFLDDKPTLTRPIPRLSRAWRWSRRNPALAGMLAASVLFTLTLAVSSSLVLKQRNIARHQTGVATVARNQADAARGRESELKKEAQEGERTQRQIAKIQRQIAYSADMKLGREYLKKHDRAKVEEILQRYVPKSGEPGEDDLRDIEWRHLRETGVGDETYTFPHESEVRGISLSEDGARLASITMSGKVRLFEVDTRKILQEHGGGNMSFGVQDGSVALSPNGRFLAAEQRGTLTVWDADKSVVLLEETNVAAPVCFSPDSRYLAGVTEAGLRIWETADWHKNDLLETSLEISTSQLQSFAFTPDSRRVICSPSRFASRLIVHNLVKDVTEGELKLEGLARPQVICTDGFIVVAGGSDGLVCVWNLETRNHIKTFKAHSGIVVAVALSRDGKTLATGGYDSEIRLWDTKTFEHIGNLKGHYSQVWNLKFSGNGRSLASASMDQSVKLWDWQRKNQILRANPTVNAQDPASGLTNTKIRKRPGSAEGGNQRHTPQIHTVTPGESIQAAVDAAMPGDRIDIAAGIHEISETIDVNKPLIIRGGATNRDDAGPFPTVLKGAEGLAWVMHLETDVGMVAEILDLQIETSGSGIQHSSGDFTLRRCRVIVRSRSDFTRVISLESMGIENRPTDTVTIDECTLSAEYVAGTAAGHTPPDVDIVLAAPNTRYVEITVTKSDVTNEVPNRISNGIETRGTTAHLTIGDNRVRCQGMGLVFPNHIGTMDIRNNTIWSTQTGISAGTESPKRSNITGNHITIDEQRLQVYPLFVREFIAARPDSCCIRIGSTSTAVAEAFFKNKVIGRGTNFWVEQNELMGNPTYGIALFDSPEPESYGPPTPNDSHDNIIARNDFNDLDAEWDIALGSSTFDNLIVDNVGVDVDGILAEAGNDDRNNINAD